MDHGEDEIREALDRLRRRGYTRLASGHGSRAPKFRHLLDEALGLARDELALLAVLMLRGPQTPGELKQRTERLHDFGSLEAVGEGLERLIGRDLVTRLGRRPGQKEERFAHLLDEDEAAGEPELAPSPARRPEPPAEDGLAERVERLEARVAALEKGLGG